MKETQLPSELAARIEEFGAWDEANRKRSESRNKVKLSLHHYSDMGALVGIIQNNELWLTSIFHMNDPSELLHGLGLAINRLDWHLAKEEKAVSRSPSSRIYFANVCNPF